MELVPIRARNYRLANDGNVEVIIQRYGRWRFGKVLASLIKEKPIVVKLDALGSFIWKMCDGKRSVELIASELQSQYGDSVESLYDRLGFFFKQMEIRGLIDWKKVVE